MAAESLQEEASCSICLDCLIDPVILHCGHNFCRFCITQSWEWREASFLCPQCRKPSQRSNLRANRQLANRTEKVKKLEEEDLCVEHNERLQLFCEEDERLICVVCNRSQEHRCHTVIPIENAVLEYKHRLKMHLKPLRKLLEDLRKFRSDEKKKTEELRSDVKIQRQKIVSQFEELRQFLNGQQQIVLMRLEGEEKKILQRIRENVAQLEKQSSSLAHLISAIAEKNQQPATELLKDVKDTLSRCQKIKFPELEAVSTDLKINFPSSYRQQLKKLITEFGDWRIEYGRYAESTGGTEGDSEVRDREVNPLHIQTAVAGGTSLTAAPWTKRELLELSRGFPSIEKSPMKFQEELRLAIEVYNPGWSDLSHLLRIVLSEDQRKKLTVKAQWPGEHPKTDSNYNDSLRTLEDARTKLIDAVIISFPPKVDWGTIFTCKQELEETPAAYWKRLQAAFQQHSGIVDPLTTATSFMAGTFVEGLQTPIQNKLKRICTDWKIKTPEELVNVASHCYNNIKENEKKMQEKLLNLQLHIYEFTRGSGRVQGRGRGKGPQKLVEGTCFQCGKEGHRKSSCPQRP